MAESSTPIDVLCMACQDSSCDFKPMRLQRRALGPKDILIDMKYCGVCHSDLHIAADQLAGVGKDTQYPCVPGHELAGICIAVGNEVTKMKVGDHVGVGCMVDSCLNCKACKEGSEQKCKKQVGTYNGTDWSGRAAQFPPGPRTRGGYCTKMVVHEHFAISLPKDYPLECAGPVLCSGITMYEPLKRYGVKPGTRLGVAGLGGLGVMGIKLGKALGCEVTAISRSRAKEELAFASGATRLVATGDKESMKAASKSLDLILNTIPTAHDWEAFQPLLDADGKQVLLGIHEGLAAAMTVASWKPSAKVVSSVIGGVANTQEVIDLCAREKIYPEVEVVPVQKLNEVYTMLDRANDAGKRYVLDLANTLNEDAFESCTAPPPELHPSSLQMNYVPVIKSALKILFKY